MQSTVDPSLFDVVDRLGSLPTDRQRRYVASLTQAERVALGAALDQRWRRDPSTFAAHLDRSFQRWRYVALLGEKFRQAVEGESTRQIIMVPFRYGKTWLASVYGPAWALDRYPDLQVILTSYGHDLALKNSSQVRDVLDRHADEVSAHPRFGSRGKERWETEQGGQVMAAGVGGAMTGFGADLLICDDPFRNWQDAASQHKRDAVWDWFRAVAYTRLQGDNSAVLIVGTRWHEDDLAGRILASDEADQWDVTRLPAVAEGPKDRGRHPWEQLPDPLDREPGDVLEPERFSPETVDSQRRQLGSYLFEAMMQQRPSVAEGSIIKRAWWRKWYISRPVEADDWLQSWDSSFKGTDSSDYCVGTCWARVGANFYLVDMVRDHMDYPTFRSAVKSFAAKWPSVRRILVEDTANGPAVMADLQGQVAGLVPRRPKGSKENRVHAVSGTIEAGNVWLPDPSVNDIDREVDRLFVHDVVDECAGFPTSSHDDIVDSITMALLEWSNTQTVTVPQTVRRMVATPGRR